MRVRVCLRQAVYMPANQSVCLHSCVRVRGSTLLFALILAHASAENKPTVKPLDLREAGTQDNGAIVPILDRHGPEALMTCMLRENPILMFNFGLFTPKSWTAERFPQLARELRRSVF